MIPVIMKSFMECRFQVASAGVGYGDGTRGVRIKLACKVIEAII